MPAPLIVTLFRIRWPGILNVPSGIQTVPPAPAAEIAELNAAVESAAPVGSAPLLVTETAPAGCAAAAGTFSKSARSIVYDEAVSPASTCNRNVVPAG
jgi:hypothetical protein